MPKFGKQSLDRLATCHPDLQKVMNEAIKHMDFVVLAGYRTPNEQFELYKKGRTFQGGKWVKTGTTVTNLDGKTKLSNHNYSPSLAIDIAPYKPDIGIDWNDTDSFHKLSDIVLKVAKQLNIDIIWGGSWKSFPDLPHFEIRGK